MGLRRLNTVEHQALTLMGRARLAGGEAVADLAHHFCRYLRARGWKPGPARRRAAQVARELADER
jgi:hypothetical protein